MQKGVDFEQLINQLENIVQKLEQGDMSLEKSIEMFEKGMALASSCYEKLEDAQLRVTKIKLKGESDGAE